MIGQPVISVIVPVFKVAKYLNKCIDSIVNQVYDNLEIILVDDGTPDFCALMCDEWAKKDDRIFVIHKINGGLSDARNCGMQLFNGEYISFIDSDDYVSNDFLEVLLSTAIKQDSSVVECGYTNCYGNGEYEQYNDETTVRDYTATESMSALIDEKPFHQHVWDKLYKREVVQGIRFEVGKQHEDEFWTYQVFGRAERISKIYRTMYFYLQRESSIMGQGYNLRSVDALEGKWNRLQYVEMRFPEMALQAKLEFFGSCMYLLQCVIKYMSGSEKCQAIEIIRNYKKGCRLKFKDIKAVQGGAKKYYYLAKINLYWCCKMRAKLNIGF